MTTIRKTISISSKDPKLQEIIVNVPNYEVSHVIRQLMYDGLKYRHLIEQGVVNDINVPYIPQKATNIHEIEEKSIKTVKNEEKEYINEEKEYINEEKEEKSTHFNDFHEEIDKNDGKREEIEGNDEDLEDLLLNNG